MKYGCIIEPGNNHKCIEVVGEFISDRLFVSQFELNIGDIVVHGNKNWFLIGSIKKQEVFFEYYGTVIEPNDYHNNTLDDVKAKKMVGRKCI